MRRTQLYLDEDIYQMLRVRARAEKSTISELVRQAVREKYAVDPARRKAALEAVIGIWADRTDLPDTETYVRSIRKDKRWKRIWR